MRVAFMGKGGAGKSSIVGTFARLAAQTGDPVLVLDSDPMPGLAHALGVEPTDAGIPDEAVVENPDEKGPRWILRDGLTAEDAVAKYAMVCADDVRLLQIGKLWGHVRAIGRSQFAFRQITREFEDSSWHMIGDLPGGTRQPFFGWGGFATHALLVLEPTAKSFLTARRLLRVTELPNNPTLLAIANKVEDEDDVARVAEATGLPVIGAVPWDPAVGEADRRGEALLDIAPDAPAVQAIRSLVERVQQETSS